MAVKEEGHHVIWLRKLIPGGTDKSYGIQVARMAGLPDSVIRRAREVLDGLERGSGNGAGLPSPEAQVAARTQRVQLKLFELEDVRLTRWTVEADDPLPPEEHLPEMTWKTQLTPSVVGAAVSPLRSMSTVDLYRYMSHLSENEQAAQRQEIQFWKKALYPFACLVMVGLALPFAYLHARSGTISVKVFGGILLGISFVLLNNVSSHLGLLREWVPWIAAAAPSALYLLLSMAAFSWLVRYR